MKSMLKNKILTITGGTGSFGKSILMQLVESDLKEIRVFSRDEKKQEDLRIKLNNSKVKFYIGDIRDFSAIKEATFGSDYIFHAAALKQVPSCEFYPLEAVKTNILGTQNLITAAKDNEVRNVVLLSTDKAVYPINAMGQSKALMEKLMVAESRKYQDNQSTKFSATRYGNVMGSRGSVIPLFISQIKNGQELTITDPSMTRFLMSLHESIDLVLHAFESDDSGSIYVKKSPAATIEDIAHSLMKILEKKVPIKIIGTRHAEKQYESLLSSEEAFRAEDQGEFYKVRADSRDLNYHEYSKYFTEGESMKNHLDYNSNNTEQIKGDDLIALLLDQKFIKEALDG